MADMLCEPEDLASLLQRDLDAYQTIMLIECATAVVQAATGTRPPQRIVQVVDDEIAEGDLMGTAGRFLQLPQWPVTAVSGVELDGESITDFKRVGSQLWRRRGWQTYCDEPSVVTIGSWTHGYAEGAQQLQLGRNSVIGLIRSLFDNPTGAESEAIDDYRVSYDRMTAAMEASPYLQKALRDAYGTRAGWVRV